MWFTWNIILSWKKKEENLKSQARSLGILKQVLTNIKMKDL